MTPRTRRAHGLRYAPAFVAALAGCPQRDDDRDPLVRSAEFGVFFGGQVQEREQIPFELDRAKQTLGFRVELRSHAGRDVPLRWEIDMPGHTKGVRDEHGLVGRGRLVKLGEGVIRPDQTRLDQTLTFEPGDPLGVWNVRVLVDGTLVIDRAFEVYDPRVRARALRADGGT